MRRTRRFCVMAAVCALCMNAVVLAGCGAGPPAGKVSPGLKSVAGGGAEVVGYLGHSDAEGGAWAVFASKPGTSTAGRPSILAMLRPGSVDEGGMKAIDGRYVWAAGRTSGDAGPHSVPVILVDGIDVVQEP